MKIAEFNQERAKRYSTAMKEYPDARNSELKELEIESLISKPRVRILDLGAGDGYLTNYLFERFNEAEIYAVDESKSMLSNFHKKDKITYVKASSENLPFENDFFDIVISLASFHHIHRKEETFKEISRVLVREGIFVIADVYNNTKTQEFFDTTVREYCITGHEFPFLDKNDVERLASQSKLFLEESKLKNTPWKFKTREDMAIFIKNLLGLDISEDLLLKILFEQFPIMIRTEGIELSWQLGYHLIKKSKETQRAQKNNLMSEREKNEFSQIIRKMPWLYTPILNEIKKYSDSSGLIDVGCGDGYLLELIYSKFPHMKLTGVDIDTYFIKKAKEKYPFEFLNEDGYNLKKQTDLIICNLALHHFDDPIKLIKILYSNSKKALIISDQLRPLFQNELDNRLERRRKLIGKSDVPFYIENEKASILEAYSKDEIIKILNSTKIPYTIELFDNDYYKRFVVVLTKLVEDRIWKLH